MNSHSINELVDFILNNHKTNGDIPTKIPFLNFFVNDSLDEFSAFVYQPSICFALQGTKAVSFGENIYTYDKSKYLLIATHVPAHIRILKASKESPYVGLSLKFSLEQIYDVLKEFNIGEFKNQTKPNMGLYFGDLNDELFQPILRLSNLLLSSKRDIDFMYPLIMKEILYILLSNDSGDFLKQYIMNGSTTNKIVKAISTIKNNFTNPINIRELAYKIGMSESSLYYNFKQITALSPLQFQKRIRLEEAKQMMLRKNIDANEVAFEVGYESPSQFSREYSRMFGFPPKAHIQKIKTQIT